jgi:hypothetical protein
MSPTDRPAVNLNAEKNGSKLSGGWPTKLDRDVGWDYGVRQAEMRR